MHSLIFHEIEYSAKIALCDETRWTVFLDFKENPILGVNLDRLSKQIAQLSFVEAQRNKEENRK